MSDKSQNFSRRESGISNWDSVRAFRGSIANLLEGLKEWVSYIFYKDYFMKIVM